MGSPRVRCPRCQKEVPADRLRVGQSTACPACNAPLRVSRNESGSRKEPHQPDAAQTESVPAPEATKAPPLNMPVTGATQDGMPSQQEETPPEEPSYITFSCPNCGKTTGFPATQRGKPAPCPACRMLVMVPAAPGQLSFIVAAEAAPATPPPVPVREMNARKNAAPQLPRRQTQGTPAGSVSAPHASAAAPVVRTNRCEAKPAPLDPLKPPAGLNRKVAGIAAGLFLVALLLVGGVFIFGSKEDSAESIAVAAPPAAPVLPEVPKQENAAQPDLPPDKPEEPERNLAAKTDEAKTDEAKTDEVTVDGKPAAPSALDKWAEAVARSSTDTVSPAGKKDASATPNVPAVEQAPASDPAPRADEETPNTAPSSQPPAAAPAQDLKDLLTSDPRRSERRRSAEEEMPAEKPAETTSEEVVVRKPAGDAQARTPAPAPEVRPVEVVREPQPQLAVQEASALGRALAAKDQKGALQHIEALAQSNAPAAVSALLKAVPSATETVFAAIRTALGEMNHPGALESLLGAYRISGDSSRWTMRILMLDAFSRRESPQALEAFRRAVSDSHSKVRLATIRALAHGEISPGERVPLLIAALVAAERSMDFGTPHWEARKALVAATGYDFQKAKDWQNFLTRSGKSYLEQKGNKTEAAFVEEYTYYELPVTSRRLAFLIDTSGSMREYDYISSRTFVERTERTERPKLVPVDESSAPRMDYPPSPRDGIRVEGEHVVGTDRNGPSNTRIIKTKEYIEWEKGYAKASAEYRRRYEEWLRQHPEIVKAKRENEQRMAEWYRQNQNPNQTPIRPVNRLERAKTELSRLLEKLPPDTFFNILTFNSKVDSYKPTLVAATPAEKAGAIAWVKKLTPDGNTVTDQALERAFEADAQADTIYLLSDGEPSQDGIVKLPIEPILARVRDLNRYHRMIINALLVGKEGQTFMKALAEENNGTFEDITNKAPAANEPAK